MLMILYILLGLGLLTVLLSLGFGLFHLAQKDDASRIKSQKMMRLRVASQFFCIIILILILVARYAS